MAALMLDSYPDMHRREKVALSLKVALKEPYPPRFFAKNMARIRSGARRRRSSTKRRVIGGRCRSFSGIRRSRTQSATSAPMWKMPLRWQRVRKFELLAPRCGGEPDRQRCAPFRPFKMPGVGPETCRKTATAGRHISESQPFNLIRICPAASRGSCAVRRRNFRAR